MALLLWVLCAQHVDHDSEYERTSGGIYLPFQSGKRLRYKTGWTLRSFLFSCSGRGKGSPRRRKGVGDNFLLKIPGGGGFPGGVGGGARGREGVRAEFGGELSIFSGPKFPPRKCPDYSLVIMSVRTVGEVTLVNASWPANPTSPGPFRVFKPLVVNGLRSPF